MEALRGPVPVFVTPMSEPGIPDGGGIRRLANLLVDAGVGGLWVLGSSGEDVNLSWQARLDTVREVAGAVGERVPVITGTGCSHVDDVLRFCDGIGGLPLAGVHVLYADPKQSNARMIALATPMRNR